MNTLVDSMRAAWQVGDFWSMQRNAAELARLARSSNHLLASAAEELARSVVQRSPYVQVHANFELVISTASAPPLAS